ncbi:alpha/beta hydrolase [Elioraea sp.]|uniref:alpha/beta hydrolase n=1 Tax=Elioraea sp. TaxID=2185103 RepID=UPI003F6F355B
MTEPTETILDALRIAPVSGTARQLVVICHGIGVDGSDMLPVARMLAGALPDTAFAAPHAPLRFSLAPQGRQWFELFDRSVGEVEDGARSAAPALARFFADECARHGLPHGAGVLAGFSQGAMMALYTGLRMADPPGAIAAFAGALPGMAQTQAELRGRPAVLIAHGEQDDIVPVQMSRDMERLLRALGLRVHALYRPGLGHGIDDEMLGALAAFCADLIEVRRG